MHYLHKNEIKWLTEAVLKLNSMDDRDKDPMLYDEVEKRTKVLLYLIPQYYFFTNSDMAADIFLSLAPDTEELIREFRISRLDYVGYLKQLCRIKAMEIYNRQAKYSAVEEIVTYDSMNTAEVATIESLVKEHSFTYRENDQNNRKRPEIETMNLPSLINYICNNSDHSDPNGLNNYELLIRRYLSSVHNRRNMLIFILSYPTITNISLMEGFARVFDLDLRVISYLFSLRHKLIEGRIEQSEQKRLLMVKYWKILMKLDKSLSYETDEIKLKEIRAHRDRIHMYYERHYNSLKKHIRVPSANIAKMTNLSRSTVCNSIKEIKKFLTAVYQSENEETAFS